MYCQAGISLAAHFHACEHHFYLPLGLVFILSPTLQVGQINTSNVPRNIAMVICFRCCPRLIRICWVDRSIVHV